MRPYAPSHPAVTTRPSAVARTAVPTGLLMSTPACIANARRNGSRRMPKPLEMRRASPSRPGDGQPACFKFQFFQGGVGVEHFFHAPRDLGSVAVMRRRGNERPADALGFMLRFCRHTLAIEPDLGEYLGGLAHLFFGLDDRFIEQRDFHALIVREHLLKIFQRFFAVGFRAELGAVPDRKSLLVEVVLVGRGVVSEAIVSLCRCPRRSAPAGSGSSKIFWSG